MTRGRGGKFKTKRGGGRNFSKHLEIDENGTAVSTDKRWARTEDSSGDSEEQSEEDEEEESEEEEEEDTAAAGGSNQPEVSRAERRELKKKQAAAKQGSDEDEDKDLINTNHVEKKLNIADLGKDRQLSRREREQKEKQEAKDRYWKLHVQGKTDEAKADLDRLKKIRAEREAAQAKRKAEAEAKAAEIEAKKKAAASGKRV